MKFITFFSKALMLSILTLLSTFAYASALQEDSCKMSLLVNNQVVTSAFPKAAELENVELPLGKSILRLQCSLTKQAVFSFNRGEILEFSWDEKGPTISQLKASKPSFVLPIGEFSADLTLVSHHQNSQYFVWKDFASSVNDNLLNNVIMGAFYGLCLTLIIYVFFMGRILGDKRYEFYSLYVFCAATFFLLQEGLLNIFFPAQAFLLSHQFYVIFAGLTVLTATIFIVRLTDLQLALPRTIKYGLQPSAALVFLISISIGFLEHHELSAILGDFMGQLTLVIMFTILGLVTVQVVKGVKSSGWILFSLLLMVIAMLFRIVFVDVSMF
jgi:diguanylate cyclase